MTYPVTIGVQHPERLSRLTTFFRPFMLIPHVVVLYFLQIAAVVILVIAWFAILFTAKYPRSLFDFEVYVFRWMTRVNGYGTLFTDKYPPFSGNE